MSYSKVVRWAI